MKGYIQVYTGNGKGKTTAALGLALRAAGAGLKVFIGQFLKRGDYSEIKALRKFEGIIDIEQFGSGKFVFNHANPDERRFALKGLARINQLFESSAYDMIIMEELNLLLSLKLLSTEEALEIINRKPESVELVITGRDAPAEIINTADLVTEMKEIKHYYNAGISARTGIEK